MAQRPELGPGRRSTAPARAPMHAATVGLILVLLALTTFSVTAAVTNARAAERAQESAVLAGWLETAEETLADQEELVDDLIEEDDDEVRAEYDAARADTDFALDRLRARGDRDLDAQVERWESLHAAYGTSVARLLIVAAADPSAAEDYETEHVDPHFDELLSDLADDVKRHYSQANEALTALGRSQQLLLVATPVVFTIGLGLLVVFSVVLARSRRLLQVQADENRHQALHDALTGLPNRTLLRSRGNEALAVARTTGTAVTLLLVDLDRFKQINDTLGHRYGDVVLQSLAVRLREALPATATVSRLGGDEFAILLPHAGDERAALQAAIVVQQAVQVSTDVDGVTLDVDASIGVVVSGEHGDDVETLLQHADIAMYRAKDRGLGLCVYDHDLNHHSAEQLGLLGELRRAIDNGELLLHYQPKLTLPDRECCGVEALVRWQHPERGLVPPGLFIPAAESTALIRPLTRYVLDAALSQCRTWHDQGRHLQMAVNVSARNLLHDAFVDDVVEALDRWQVPASWLELEVTESTIMADPERARDVLQRLAALGITLSIDDFGAGYTSMAHLSKLPLHQLKIDRSLVSRIGMDASDALIVRSVIDLGHNLGLRVVAEGVEDEATAVQLERLGCDVVQGFHFSRPLPAAAVPAWWDANRTVLV